MDKKQLPVGFFDSGVGGLSVLLTAREMLPNENYIYYGDGANAPYGGKTSEEIKKLTFSAINVLLNEGIKALVVACNTATSVAIEGLRAKLDIPVIGMEPAVKPAISYADKGRILVMATQATLRLPKFGKLVEQLHIEDEIIPLPAPRLAELVEIGVAGDIKSYLQILLKPYVGKVSAVVLGCTHYIFCIDIIRSIMNDIPIIHGNVGTVMHLKNILETDGLINETGGSIRLMSSSGAESIKRFEGLLGISDKLNAV